jgi:hypothetical protein
MSFKEFGTVVEKAPTSFEEFGEKVEEPSRLRSLLSAFPKGVTKEIADIYELFQKVPLPKGEANPEAMRKFAEEKFPTQEKGPEKLLERAGRIAPGALLSPGGPLVKGAQIGAGALLGQGLEEGGAPTWVQAIAESLPFFFSGGKKIPLKPNQKKLGEFLRKNGLTENEITPLLKSPEQINRWSSYAEKGEKSRKLMEGIYQKTGNIYDSVLTQGKNLPPLADKEKTVLIKELHKIYDDMPDKYRKLIQQDLKDFLTKGRAGVEDIVNLDKDINAVIGAEHGGRAIIGQFKEPLQKAMQSISPEVAQDYQLAKEFYRTRQNVKGALLNRGEIDKFLDIGEAYGMAAGTVNRDLGLIAKTVGAIGGRKIAREMLINPRLQNISVRIGEALKKNKFTLADKYIKEFSKEIGKDDPELGFMIDDASSNEKE